MILITGGAYQGKLNFVRDRLGVKKTLGGSSCAFDEMRDTECIYDYHELVRRLIGAELDPTEFTEKLCKENPGAVIIINEVGSGVIPIEKQDRIWREAVGRCGCILAEHSSLVVRMVCGIPHVIKGELP